MKVHRPRTAAARSATILGLYLGAGLVAAVVPLAGLSADWSIAAGVIALVVAFVVGQQLVWYAAWAQFAGVLAAAVFVLPVSFAAPASVLAASGDRVTATVIGVDKTEGLGKSTGVYRFGLVDEAGRPIPGFLVEPDRAYDVGDRVAVVVDRSHQVEPETVGEVDRAALWWLLAVVGLVLTVVLSVVGGRSRGDDPKPGRGRSGLWVFSR